MPAEVVNLSSDKKKELAGYLHRRFSDAQKARTTQIDSNYRRWIENYYAKPKVATRTTPFYKASNFVPQLIRMHTDIMHARLLGLLFAAKPFWKIKTFIPGLASANSLRSLSEWFEQQSFINMDLFDCLDKSLAITVKTGTNIIKGPWVSDEVYLGTQGRKLTKEGICLMPVPFDDFFPYPITAPNLNSVLIKFHRLRFAKEEVEYRKANLAKGWDPTATDRMLGSEPPTAEAQSGSREAEAASAGVQLTTDVTRPFTAIESWLDYNIDNSGKMYRIVCTFNPYVQGEDSLLKCVYNDYSSGIDPFVDYRIMPRDGLFFGMGFGEILEQSQEEQAQVHNQRRDNSTISNVPTFKKLRTAGVPNPSSEWYPGKTFELNQMTDLEVLQFNVQYQAMIEEETQILTLAERYTGVSPPMQGAGAGSLQGKRGIYNTGGTLALLAEGNRRVDAYLRRLRLPSHRLGNLIFQSHKDFRPEGPEYQAWGEMGEAVQKFFKAPAEDGFRGLFYDIGASDAGANQETERTSLLLMSNTMAAYYKQLVEASQILGRMGPDADKNPVGKVLLAVLSSAKDLSDRLLFAFNVGDRKSLTPDVNKLLGIGPQDTAEFADSRGMPQPEQALQRPQLSDLSERLAALQGASNPTSGNESGQRPI